MSSSFGMTQTFLFEFHTTNLVCSWESIVVQRGNQILTKGKHRCIMGLYILPLKAVPQWDQRRHSAGWLSGQDTMSPLGLLLHADLKLLNKTKTETKKKKHYSQCFPLNTNYRRKQRKGTVLVQSKDKWGHYGSVCDTQDSITELRQVGQESGTSPWQCVRGQIGGGGKRSCVLGEREKKKRRRRKASSFLPIGHKSCGWVMLFYSLPFSVPTHSCVTAKSQNKYAFLSAFCQWVCEKQNERRSFRTTICASVCVSVSVCVIQVSVKNVITCMSKRALVYVSKMAPVLSKSGLPADTQLQMSAARPTFPYECVRSQCVYREATDTDTHRMSKTQFPLKTNNYLKN